MSHHYLPKPLWALSLAVALPVQAEQQPAAAAAPAADQTPMLQEVVVTAPPMQAPLEVRFDPKAAQQPLPAQDGAAFLKTVPGMSLIRKGGTDGDPV
jgi:iron complex outermembrane receptor protein